MPQRPDDHPPDRRAESVCRTIDARCVAPRRAAIVAATLVLASGCAVDQKKEVALYRSVLDARIPPPATYDPGAPLTLPGAMALAVQADETLAARGEDYVQALINRNRALAAFLPTVSFQPAFSVAQPSSGAATGTGATSGGQTAALGPILSGLNGNAVGALEGSSAVGEVFPNAGAGVFRKTGGVLTRFEAPVVGSMNLFRGFGDVANVEVARFDIEYRKELMLDLQDTILLNVAQGFYQVLRSEQQVDVLRNSLAVQEARVRLVQDQFNEKLATRLAVAQSEAQADATRVTLVQAQGDVRNGRATLAFLIGVPQVTAPLVDDLSPPAARPPLATFSDDALKFHRDLIAAAANVQAARRAVDVYVSQYYPAVSLNVSGFLYREFFSDATKWDAILSANLPVFSAGLIRADVRQAWSRLRQAALLESNLRRSVLRDVEIAYSNLATADREIIELEGEVAAAAEAYRQSESAFNNGLAINLDVLQAQDQLLTAQLQLTSARYDRVVFYLDLIRATGRLTPTTLVPVNHPPTTLPVTTMPSTMRAP